ncbi:hypothetical protein TNCV_3390731 [Trichonephila clavipes]|nr:hypothetical protein TNCV_3390731 [Trichonephila clavipes]
MAKQRRGITGDAARRRKAIRTRKRRAAETVEERKKRLAQRDERRPEKEKNRKRQKRGGDPKGEVEEKSSEKTRADRLRKRRGESQSFLLGDADQESETEMSKNALWTGRRQAVERATPKRVLHTGLAWKLSTS